MDSKITTASKDSISLYEVTARDGFQNESEIIDVESKYKIIQALVLAGYRDIEVSSFVKPSWIPQLADGEELLRMLTNLNIPKDLCKPRFWALIPNYRGLERALSVGVENVATVISASESHNRKNLNRTQKETLFALQKVIPTAKQDSLLVRSYISTVFGCPYEGEVDLFHSSSEIRQQAKTKIDKTLDVVEELLTFGSDYIALGDTTGMANPRQIQYVIQKIQDRNIPLDKIALHLHDTRGTALANALAGYQSGIRTFDGSTAGLGGCPYAPGATGNAASEDLLNMFESMGIRTNVNLEKATQTGILLSSILQRELSGRYHRYAKAGLCSDVANTA
jgi:hydroxymethylglutaryl-CoA lyase